MLSPRWYKSLLLGFTPAQLFSAVQIPRQGNVEENGQDIQAPSTDCPPLHSLSPSITPPKQQFCEVESFVRLVCFACCQFLSALNSSQLWDGKPSLVSVVIPHPSSILCSFIRSNIFVVGLQRGIQVLESLFQRLEWEWVKHHYLLEEISLPGILLARMSHRRLFDAFISVLEVVERITVVGIASYRGAFKQGRGLGD